MNDEKLMRYSRHILLKKIDVDGQQKLLNAKIMIIGLGGLGSSSAMYLAASGVGTLFISDIDIVELSNLQRQIIYTTSDIGKNKVDSAYKKLISINPTIKIVPLKNLSYEQLLQHIINVDIVVDGTDNFKSKFLINKYCHTGKTVLISGAAVEFSGQLAVYKSWLKNNSCYNCLYKDTDYNNSQRCIDNGILSPLVGMVGTMQAIQTIKIILNLEDTLISRLLLIDGLDLTFKKIEITKDLLCPVCAMVS